MVDNQNPNPHGNPSDPPVLPKSDVEGTEMSPLFDEEWLKDPLDMFYNGPKLEIPPQFGSSSFDNIDIDHLVEQVQADTFSPTGTVGSVFGGVGTVGSPGAVGAVGGVGSVFSGVGTVGSFFGGGGVIDWKEKERERERQEEIEREKWKKKMTHARSLLMERKRTTKLNENFLKLRAAVPKISNFKMDRMSTLCDAIDYIKEVKQNIQVLQNEIEPGDSSSSSSSFNQTMEPYSLPQFQYLGSRSSFVDVKTFEDGKMYIHLFCKPNPSLISSVIRVFQLLNLDAQIVSISTLNSFAFDAFCSKQPDNMTAWKPEQIKSLLMDSIGAANQIQQLKF